MDVTKSGATPPLGLEELLALTQISEELPEEGSGSDAESPSSDDDTSSIANSAFGKRFAMVSSRSAPVIRTRSHLSIDPSVLSPATTATSRTADTGQDDFSSWTTSTKSSRRSLGSAAGSASTAAKTPSSPPTAYTLSPDRFFKRGRFIAVDSSTISDLVEKVSRNVFTYTDHAKTRRAERHVNKPQVMEAIRNMLLDNTLVAKCNDEEVRRYSIYRFVGPDIVSPTGTSRGKKPERVVVIVDITDCKIITLWKTRKTAEQLRKVFR